MTVTRTEKKLTRALFEAIYPASPGLPIDIGKMDIESFVDDLNESWPRMNALAFRFAVVAVTLASLVALRTWRLPHTLPVERRAEALRRIQYGPFYVLRQLVTLLKAAGGMLYGGDPAVRRAIAPGAENTTATSSLLRKLRPQEAR